MIRLYYPLPDVPGYRLVHRHNEGEGCVLDEFGRGYGCRYTPKRLTRLRQRALRAFRSAP